MTFDFGQTLASLDHRMLAARVAERDVVLDAGRAEQATPGAWQAYNQAKRDGAEGEQAWMSFMRTLLATSGVEATRAEELAAWLFREQPTQNLWRKRVTGMFELAAQLDRADVTVGIVSNSEGRLEELVEELGWRSLFRAIADSGKLGVEKPDPRIFEWVAEALGVRPERLVHIGDSWEADVKGALAFGARAIWFDSGTDATPEVPDPERFARCRDAGEVRAALVHWRVL